MSERSGPRRLIEPELLGRWMVEHWYIWQMRLLDSRQLAKFSRERGVGVAASSGKDVESLWQLGLLRADYVQSPKELSDAGLVIVTTDARGQHLYADARDPSARSEGWLGAGADLEELDRDVEPFFHPFRFYVVRNILHGPVFFPPRPNISAKR
jgi:hypothetical protein